MSFCFNRRGTADDAVCPFAMFVPIVWSYLQAAGLGSDRMDFLRPPALAGLMPRMTGLSRELFDVQDLDTAIPLTDAAHS
ncbi:MAG: hypothetical protein R3E51_00030 [Rhizobiaceae bacterium]